MTKHNKDKNQESHEQLTVDGAIASLYKVAKMGNVRALKYFRKMNLDGNNPNKVKLKSKLNTAEGINNAKQEVMELIAAGKVTEDTAKTYLAILAGKLKAFEMLVGI